MLATSARYSPSAVGSRLRISTVGPATNTKIASISASTMLMLDSHWMPRETPDTAEATKASVSSATTATSSSVPASPTQPRTSMPEPIWRAPSPSEAAVPNMVAKMARMSMILPIGPSTRLRPNSGMNDELINCRRPIRYVP